MCVVENDKYAFYAYTNSVTLPSTLSDSCTLDSVANFKVLNVTDNNFIVKRYNNFLKEKFTPIFFFRYKLKFPASEHRYMYITNPYADN
jgi:hypothetical protein